MKYRSHRGHLVDSMQTVVELSGRADLIGYLKICFSDAWLQPPPKGRGPVVSDETVKVTPYGGDDDRIGWKNVHIVVIEGWGPTGFCEGPAD